MKTSNLVVLHTKKPFVPQNDTKNISCVQKSVKMINNKKNLSHVDFAAPFGCVPLENFLKLEKFNKKKKSRGEWQWDNWNVMEMQCCVHH